MRQEKEKMKEIVAAPNCICSLSLLTYSTEQGRSWEANPLSASQ